MKTWKRILAFCLMAIPALLTAQWARYGDYGQPHALLEAPSGGWIIAGKGNIFELSPAGEVVWGQTFDDETPYSYSRRVWSTPDNCYMAVLKNYGEPVTLFKLSATGGVVWKKAYSLANAFLDVFSPTPEGGALMAGHINSDLLICRCSAEGEIVWQRSYGTGDAERATAVAPTSDGGAVVLSSCAPDSWPTQSDVWILKLASTGDIEWQKRIGGAADDEAGTVFQTADGGYLIAGRSASFDADGQKLFWLLKLSAAGTVQRQLTLDYLGGTNLKPVADGSFIAAFTWLPSLPDRAVVVTIAEDGTIIREKPYAWGDYSFFGRAILPTEDGGCLLSMTGKTTVDDPESDSLLMKLLPSGEIEWQKIYGSRYSPDWVSLLGRASDGSYVLAGTTSSWGSLWDHLPFTWILRIASDGSIGPNCPFIRDAAESPLDEVSTQKEVVATVTDTAAVPQSTGLVAETADINFVPWGPTELPALGQPTCTLKINASVGGTITPAAGSRVYATGTQVRIEAVPNAKYEFLEWIGNIRLKRPSATIVMDGNKEIYANFYYVGEGIEKIMLELESGCFIATAAYGSPVHPYVNILRDFRNKYLMPNKLGRALIKIYYKYSPFVASFIAKHKALKVPARIILLPVIAFSYSMVHFGPIITAVMIAVIFILPIFLILLSQGRMRRVEAKDPRVLASLD